MSSSFFLEERMLGDIIGIISQKRSKETKVQVIQTISILVQNIRDEKSLCSVFPRIIWIFEMKTLCLNIFPL